MRNNWKVNFNKNIRIFYENYFFMSLTMSLIKFKEFHVYEIQDLRFSKSTTYTIFQFSLVTKNQITLYHLLSSSEDIGDSTLINILSHP